MSEYNEQEELAFLARRIKEMEEWSVVARAQLAAKEQELAEAREQVARYRSDWHAGAKAWLEAQEKELIDENASIRQQLTASRENCDAWAKSANAADDRLKATLEQLTARDATIEGLKKVKAAAECIRHWHDASNGGMIVSGDHVRALWKALHDLDSAQLPPLPSAVPEHPDTARRYSSVEDMLRAVLPEHAEEVIDGMRKIQANEILELDRFREVLHDGHLVLQHVTERERGFTTPENVSAVLDAFKRALADAARQSTGEQGTEGAGELDGH